MGRVKQSKGRRDGPQKPLHWTPLEQACRHVVEWSWDSTKIPPPVFVQWCLSMLDAPCLWCGAETGIEVPQDQEMISLTTAQGRMYTRKAKGERRTLGIELTRQATELSVKLKQDDVAGILVSIPAKYQRVMRAKGHDPVETWLEMRLMDIFLNLGQVTLTDKMIEMLPEPKQ